MVLKNFGRLKFPNYDEIFFVIREHTVHVTCVWFLWTCWYTTYYWIRHAARQVLSSPHARMTLALPFWSLRSARIVWILSQCSFLTCSWLGSTKSYWYRLDGYTAPVQDRPPISSHKYSVITPLTGVNPSYPCIKPIFLGDFWTSWTTFSGGAIGWKDFLLRARKCWYFF